MVKLYKRIDNDLYYAECWISGGTATTHYGVVGDKGKAKTAPCPNEHGHEYENAFSEKYKKQGYILLDAVPQTTVVLRLKVNDAASGVSLYKKLYEPLNNDLGWTGLGHVDGYDVDAKKRPFRNSYLRIFCVTVDAALAAVQIRITANRLGYEDCFIGITAE